MPLVPKPPILLRGPIQVIGVSAILAAMVRLTTDDMGTAVFVLVTSLMVLGAWLYTAKCPKCGRYELANKRLPAKKDEQDTVEMRCGHCDYHSVVPNMGSSSSHGP